MLNSTCFKSDTIRCKIIGAMRRSMTTKTAQILTNRKGDQFLRIERLQGVKQGRIFRFTDLNGDNVTDSAYNGLKA